MNQLAIIVYVYRLIKLTTMSAYIRTVTIYKLANHVCSAEPI